MHALSGTVVAGSRRRQPGQPEQPVQRPMSVDDRAVAAPVGEDLIEVFEVDVAVAVQVAIDVLPDVAVPVIQEDVEVFEVDEVVMGHITGAGRRDPATTVPDNACIAPTQPLASRQGLFLCPDPRPRRNSAKSWQPTPPASAT